MTELFLAVSIILCIYFIYASVSIKWCWYTWEKRWLPSFHMIFKALFTSMNNIDKVMIYGLMSHFFSKLFLLNYLAGRVSISHFVMVGFKYTNLLTETLYIQSKYIFPGHHANINKINKCEVCYAGMDRISLLHIRYCKWLMLVISFPVYLVRHNSPGDCFVRPTLSPGLWHRRC